jgi:hypothetical protein
MTSEPLDIQPEPTALNNLIAQTELNIKVQKDEGQAWTALRVDAPSDLASKLSSSLLQSVVGDLTELTWLNRPHPPLHTIRQPYGADSSLANGLLPSLENCI